MMMPCGDRTLVQAALRPLPRTRSLHWFSPASHLVSPRVFSQQIGCDNNLPDCNVVMALLFIK